jgi:hypothetical protein
LPTNLKSVEKVCWSNFIFEKLIYYLWYFGGSYSAFRKVAKSPASWKRTNKIL